MILGQFHYGGGLPPDLSQHGHAIDSLIEIVHWFMLLLFVGWGIFFVYCLTKFRRREGGRALYVPVKAKASKYAEIGVGIFEAVVLLAFSMPVWSAYKNSPPPKDKRLEIHVVGEQFQWDFHYPGKDGIFGRTSIDLMSGANPLGLDENDPAGKDDIWMINECHLPTDRDIYVRLSSKDVIHSLSIPTMRIKQDAVPGMPIAVWFKIQPEATTDRLKEQMTITVPIGDVKWDKYRHHIAMKDYKDKDGDVIVGQGKDLGATFKVGEETIEKLKKAGVSELVLQPKNPLEIICAQLCGNSHFKMKAQLITHTAAGFEEWEAQKQKEKETGSNFEF